MDFDELIRPWLGDLTERIPGLDLFDAHTHIGHNDPDGYRSPPEQLTRTLAMAGARAVVFPMHEPDGYPAANDMVIEEAARSEGRLVPFCRLDPACEPLGEAERCLAAGAAGIKLHPRAERFALDSPQLRGVFELAGERGLCVLVHAGRGIPALGRHALQVCERHPGLRLILAHAGICDLAWIWRATHDHPNLFFDTAWWSPSDLQALYALVPPRHILFASDAPYATTTFAATVNLRYGLHAGLSGDHLRLVFGGQLAHLLAGEEPLDVGVAPGRPLPADPLLDRVYAFLLASVGQMLRGVEPVETLGLAALACEVGEGQPQAEACAAVLRLLELRERFVASGAEDERPPRFAPGLQFVVMAACLVRTPDIAIPPTREPEMGVGEREE